MKTGLVLEGGGMRGIYTAGVLDVFMEQGISFDGVIGVSAGAIHGSSFLSGQKGRNIRYYREFCRDHRFISLRNLLMTGDLAEETFCYHTIPEQLYPYDYQAFSENPTEFYVGCSNVETGKPEYLRVTDMKTQVDYIRASASLPLVSRIVETAGKKLLDGGCTDSIPAEAFISMGFERNVVVLTRHRGYQKKAEKAGLSGMYYRRYPAFVQALKHRHLTYNRSLERIFQLEKQGTLFVISPSVPLTIGRMERNPDKLKETYLIGASDAKAALLRLRRWMEDQA